MAFVRHRAHLRQRVADPFGLGDRQRVVALMCVDRQQDRDELVAGLVSKSLLTVDAGAVVDFPNNDSTYHNVFSLSKIKKFDLGRYARGKSKAVMFDRPGVVRIFCDIHSHMSAYVLVFSHPFFGVTDAQGRYTLANVPAGTHTVKVWSELGSAESRRVTVGAGVVDADFRVERTSR